MAFARTVVESHLASKTIDDEIKKTPRLGDIYEGHKWRLARNPEVGYLVPKSEPATYVLHTFHWGVSALRIAYHFNDDQVEIFDIQVLHLRHDKRQRRT